MEITQRRNSHRIRYVFGEQGLEYQLQDSSGSRTFNVDYTDISRDRQTLVERNDWLRNAGLLWLGLGVVLTAVKWMEGETWAPSMWLFVGAICYAAYRMRSTPFTLLPTSKGNLRVIDDASGAQILDEITSRRAQAYRAEYDFFPEGDTQDAHRRRFNWLHEEGVLTKEQLEERLEQIATMSAPSHDAEAPPMRQLLN